MKTEELPSLRSVTDTNKFVEELTTASIRKSCAGMGGCKEYKKSNYNKRWVDLIEAYINNEIDSVTAIYICMKRCELKYRHLK